MPVHAPARPITALCLCILALLAGCSEPEATLPSFYRWGRIELVFQGPAVRGMAEPNPFNIPLDVMFTAPDGSTHLVPGFYDGDGAGSLDGNVWKVRFSAGRNGTWNFHTQSPDPSLDGLSGQIAIIDPPDDTPDLYHLGRLEYVGERYLKFPEGGYWIKAGADEPENLLGAAFGRGDWAAKKRQIDYLASTGVNSVYIMTHNLGGDGRDVWPWAGATEEEAKLNHERYDVAKLEHWRDLFEYIQSRGLVIHLVLEDDSAWTGYNPSRYYREIVARFGYLPALYFNFCEEYNESHSLEEALGRMGLLATIDPYNHPRAIHNVNLPRDAYIDSPAVQVASIQTDPSKPATLNQLAIDWFEAARARAKRPLVVSFDEARPPEDRRSWWAVYLGGGIWESLLRVENSYDEFDRQWRELDLARQFMQALPVDRMFPFNQSVESGSAFCLAQPGVIYALYLPDGGEIKLNLPAANRYSVRWFDPRWTSSDPWSVASEITGGLQALQAPGEGDYAVLIERIAGETNAAPVAFSAKLTSTLNAPVTVHLSVWQPAEPGALNYEIVQAPHSGRLSGNAPNVTYTPRPGFTGQDLFQWKVSGVSGESGVATVTLTCNATGENQPPRAYPQTVRAAAAEPTTFILRYNDRDGPGPYRIRIVTPPAHGTAEGLDNDITYTPEEGFTGQDSLEWEVSDGAGRSNRARVRISVR